MSYQVLARSCRPQNFAAVIGQPSTTDTLIHALQQQRLHHAYLFTGTRGVGKTSIARILAKCLNCEQGISENPCNQCTSCQDITHGRSIDLLEVDAASRTKVEETRELLENINYAPQRSRFKIYLIDEVHMLSKHSFNALLKTIEEPPSHVKFLFATTDPQKIPATIISRCLQFHLRRVDIAVIEQHLTSILQQRNIAFEAEALNLIAHAADGSVRDALSLLDQAISHGQGKLVANRLQQMLGITSQQHIQQLLMSLLQDTVQPALDLSQQLGAQGTDFKQVLDQLLHALHHMAIAEQLHAQGVNPQLMQQAVDNPYAELHQHFSAQRIHLLYQITLNAKRDFALAPSAQAGFDMLLLRMFAFQLHQPHTSKQATVTSTPPTITSTPTTTATAQQTDKLTTTAQPADKPITTTQQTGKSPSGLSSPSATTTKTTAATATDPSPLDINQWSNQLIDQLALTGAARALAQQCSICSYQHPELILSIEEKHKTLAQPKYIQRIEQALKTRVATDITLKLQTQASGTVESPSHQAQQHAQQQREALHNSDFVNDVINTFDGRIIS